MIRRLGLPEALFSLNSFAAAMLALYIGFSLDLPRPYWAMLTVYITVQPLSGALRSKAVYRIAGTVLGGVAAVALVPNLVDSPLILSMALAGWVAVCLYLSLLDRTPRAYVFMLAGYTAAIIGFPSVDAPGTIFDTALARVEEITLGIVCAAFVHSIFFPRSVLSALTTRIEAVMRDVEDWAAETWTPDVLAGRAPVNIRKERRRLAADVTELQVLSTHLPFDTAARRPTTRSVRALQDRLALLLPLASAVEDRRQALVAIEPEQPELGVLLGRARDWMSARQPGWRTEGSALAAACLAAEPEIGPDSGWADLLKASLLGRLAELLDAISDARLLADHIRAPDTPVPVELTRRLSGGRGRPLHLDHGLAALSAFAAFAAVLGCCGFWIATAWPEGAVAPMFAAVFMSFFAAQDDPARPIAAFLVLTLISLPIAALYLFLILPAIDGFPMLAAALAPILIVLGALQSDVALIGIAIPLLLGLVGSLSLQEVFSADFASFSNNSVGQIVAIGAALTTTQLLRSVGADWSARRILRFGWRELAANAAADRVPDRVVWNSRMLDRLGLFLPRLALSGSPADLVAADPLKDLRIGINVADLQAARAALGPGPATTLTRLLEGVARHFRALGQGRQDRVAPSVLMYLDQALDEVAMAAPSPERRDCLWSLTGLRRNLFPAAPVYTPNHPALLDGAAA